MIEYIHYGSNKFDKNKFIPIRNEMFMTKPKGGMWASRVDSDYGWFDWCNNNDFELDFLKKSFK